MASPTMAALTELASRPRRQDFAADEIASAFNVTWLSAAAEIDYARTVKGRLPVTFAALGAGKLHPVHVKIIEEVTGILSDEDAAIADKELAEAAQSKTYGELRRAATRLVLKLDAEAVRKRKEKARRTARSAGVPGGIRQRRDYWQGDAVGGGAGLHAACRGSCPCSPRRWRPRHLGGAEGPRHSGPAARTRLPARHRANHPRAAAPRDLAAPPADAGPSIGAIITITVPHTALGGDCGPPGDVAGFGIVDHADTRDLVAAAAGHPATRWCVTVLNPDGTAAAHRYGAVPSRWPPGQGPPGAMTLRGLLEFLNIRRPTPGHPRTVPARPGRAPLPAQPQTPAPDQGPQRDLHGAGVRPPRRELRPGPHRPPPPRRPDVRVQSGPIVQTITTHIVSTRL